MHVMSWLKGKLDNKETLYEQKATPTGSKRSWPHRECSKTFKEFITAALPYYVYFDTCFLYYLVVKIGGFGPDDFLELRSQSSVDL